MLAEHLQSRSVVNYSSLQLYIRRYFFTDIISRSVDVYTGNVSVEYQVNSTPVDYPWDINRAYAVGTCSNSGFDILSAYFTGHPNYEIMYKVSGNTLISISVCPTTILKPTA